MQPLPMPVRVGDNIRAHDFNLLTEAIRWLYPIAGKGINVNHSPGGTTYSLNTQPNIGIGTKGNSTTVNNTYNGAGSIWQPYQISASSTSSADHLKIQVNQGYVNGVVPTGCSVMSIKSGSTITLADNATTHFYIDCTISTVLDQTEGTVTAVALTNNTSWWTGYPVEPVGSSATGAPPSHFYINLYDIPVSASIVTLPTAWSANNYWVDEVTFGNPTIDSTGNCIIFKRMTMTIA